MSISIYTADQTALDLSGAHLDDLEVQAEARGLLIRQDPKAPGTYEVSDGRAFRACPVVPTVEGLEQRRRKHAAAGQV